MNIKKKPSFFDDFEDITKPINLNKIVLNDKNKNKLNDNNKIKSQSIENQKTNEYNGFTIIDTETLKKKNLEEQKKELIRTSAVLNPKNQFSLKSSITSIASTFLYNYFNNNKKFDSNNFKTPLILFDLIISKQNIKLFYYNVLTFFYMSYRSDFTNLNLTGSGNYTTDCGWGCMIRSCQMMLSKALIERKKYNYWGKYIINLDIGNLKEIRKKILVFFLDNNVPIQNLISHNDYQFFWDEYSKLCLEDEKYTSLSEVIAPYSIQTICKVAKCAGKYTSDINMIKAFIEINKIFFNDLEIVHFECGTIKKQKILDMLCSEIVCSCNYDINKLYKNENEKNSVCEKCFKEMILNNEIQIDDILYNKENKKYIFKKAGIIFISFRLGLNQIHPDYIPVIPYLFTHLHHNIGFVSGKENKAFYFIGLSGNELLYIDPHLNQTSVKSDLSDIKSYYVKDIYLLNVSEISSELTIGVLINCCEDLRIFFNDLNWFLFNFPDFLRVD